ncbi:hypothetical protein Cgig2_006873 [Carnegiea gigantea]|uniref:Uncharacterized protein n=1 Tax=Carnegiea gigantea TaxID=171969 RepID=A0A9Q1JRM8_9CARY|nr:hypothetical protein Cgig2_006873 [Carnegiea gigantea]
MNALYRDYRRKLKAKYYDDPELINRMKENNKPRKVLKSYWLYLCTLWHDPQFQKEPTRAEILIESRKRKITKPVDKEKLANNVDAVMDDEEIFKKVLGEEKHGYLRAYGRNKSIIDHFGVKPTQLNLIYKVVEIEKKADEQVQETTRKMEEKMEEKLAERDMERDKLLAERDKWWEERFKKLCDSLGVPQTNQIPQNEST